MRYAAWSLDAACLLPLVVLLAASKLGYALAAARTQLQAIASEFPRLLGDAPAPPVVTPAAGGFEA